MQKKEPVYDAEGIRMSDPGSAQRKRIDHESPLMRALFHWATLQTCVYPELRFLHHIPNGEKRDRITAAKLKGMGVKSGIPDIFLPVPAGGYHGLYIELKAPGEGRVSKDQKKVIAFLQEMGYRVEVCYGWEPAKNILVEYLKTYYRERKTTCQEKSRKKPVRSERSKTQHTTAEARS